MTAAKNEVFVGLKHENKFSGEINLCLEQSNGGEFFQVTQ